MTSNQKLLERLTREEKLKYAASLRKVAGEFIALAETFESDRCMPDGRPAIVYDPYEPAKGRLAGLRMASRTGAA